MSYSILQRSMFVKEWILRNPTGRYQECADQNPRYNLDRKLFDATRSRLKRKHPALIPNLRYHDDIVAPVLKETGDIGSRLAKIFQEDETAHRLTYKEFCDKYGSLCSGHLFDLAKSKYIPPVKQSANEPVAPVKPVLTEKQIPFTLVETPQEKAELKDANGVLVIDKKMSVTDAVIQIAKHLGIENRVLVSLDKSHVVII